MTPELTEELRSGVEGGGPESRKAMKQMGADGLLGVSWPKQWGGRERGEDVLGHLGIEVGRLPRSARQVPTHA